MKYRIIPGIDVSASVIGMGCANIASLSNPIPKTRALSTLRAAFDNGINFFDTADSYGQGRSEQLIGEAFKHDRDKVIMATKAGYTFGVAGKGAMLFKDVIKAAAKRIPGVGNAVRRLRLATQKQDFSPHYIRHAVEASLVRLRTDYIDIFMLHNPPFVMESQDEVTATLKALQQEGKILRYGVSMESLEPGIHPLHSDTVYQFPLLASGKQVYNFASQLKADSAITVARQAFQYCSEEIERDVAFREKLHEISDDFHDAALAFCLQTFPIDVLLVGMTRPETAQRNATVYSRISGDFLDAGGVA